MSSVAESSVPLTPPSEVTPLLRRTSSIQADQGLNDKERASRARFFLKLVQTTLLCPVTSTVVLAYRMVKLITWVPVMAVVYKLSGYHTEAANYFEREYLKTVRAVRDLLFIPVVIGRAAQDLVASREEFADDLPRKQTQDYLKVGCTKAFH